MHVIFVAPHFPAGQRRFVRGLKNVGARVTGIVDVPLERVDSEVMGLLDDVVSVPSVGNEEAMLAAVKHIQKKGPWVYHLEATIEPVHFAATTLAESVAAEQRRPRCFGARWRRLA